MRFKRWEEVKLGDIVESISERHQLDKSKVVLINTSDIYDGYVLNHTYVDNKNIKGQFKKSFRKGDILYSEIRPKNKRFAYVDFDPRDYVASTKLMVLRKSSENVNSDFLYQVLKSDNVINRLQLLAETRSGTFPQITYDELANLKIKLPPLEEQKFIAHILSTLDEKIELNNKINKTLEDIAQAIFKHWFVDFEFPNEDGEPYKSSGGEMVESELGMIPKGWEVRRLGDFIELYDFKRIPLSKKERDSREKIYPYYGAASLMDYVDDYIFDGVYVLMGEDGTVADVNGCPILQYVWGKFWVNNHAHVIKGKRGLSEEFIYNLLKNVNVKPIITGAVQPKINQQNLKGLKIILPKDDTMIRVYSDIGSKSFEKIRCTADENKILEKIRDTLLPKLMSGEIRVPLDQEGDCEEVS